MHPAIRQRWPEVRALFEAALKLPRPERAAFVAAHAVDAELAAATALLLAEEPPTLAEHAGGAALEPPLSQPLRLGDYELVRVLGRGGMGVVYLARQSQPQRLVAIKMIAGAPDASALARFHREADILARLSHPGIAQVYALEHDADGQPFLVMEYVDGEPLAIAMARLSRQQRLQLMARVADAVEHAHARGIVHRDLKPGNILIAADGQPKVLDFGIAYLSGAAIATLTATGALLGTPAYMSPEQASGLSEVDCRADVYALGAMLYEQLSGRLPVPVAGLTPLQALRQVSEHTPLPLGLLDRQLRGELQTIAETALQKDPRLRYPSAGALADDLRRLLADNPIRARRVGAVRRGWLFVRRNPALASALLVAVLALLGGTAAALHQAQVAQEQARRAQAAATRSAAVSATLMRLLSAGHPDENGGAPVTVIDLLRQGGTDALRPLEGDPAIRRAVLAEIGALHQALGDDGRVLALLEPELTALPPRDDEDGWRMALTLAESAATLSNTALAARWYGQLGPVVAARPVVDRLRHDYELAHAGFLRDQDRTQEALNAMQTWATALADHQAPAAWRSQALQTLADIQLATGAHAAARTTVALIRGLPETAETALSRARVDTLLARAETELDRPQQAVDLLRESLGWHERVLGADHNLTLTVREELGNALGNLAGQGAEARAIIADVLERRRRLFGAAHPKVAVSLNQLAVSEYNDRLFHDAAAHFDAAVQIWQRVLPADHDHLLTAQGNLAATWIEAGQADRALPILNALVERRRAARTTAFDGLLISRGLALEQLDQLAAAKADYGEALQFQQQIAGSSANSWVWAQVLLGRVERRMGHLDAARALLESGVQTYLASPYGCGLRCAVAHLELARTLADQRLEPQRVRALAGRALEIRRGKLGPEDPLTLEASELLGGA